ncbi:MAG: DUF5666 domain-containing protein [Pseudomonadota bacterium]
MKVLKLMALLSVLVIMAVPAFAAGGAAQSQEVQGQVSSIDQQNKTMQVGGKTLSFNDQTKVIGPRGEQSNISSLSEGEQVKASFMKQDGKNVAQRIELMMPSGGAGAGGGMGGMQGGGGMGGAPSGGTRGGQSQ